MPPRFHVGVSGFSYAGWKGRFYPKETRSEEFLRSYASRLNSVEINSSFYAFPKEASVRAWADKTSEDFVFALKAPQQITHVLKLGEGSPEAAERFSKVVDILGPRRGPLLFQLPPFAKQDLKKLEEFLTETSEVKCRVFEFRHESWLGEPTYRLLDEHNAGFCIAETEEMAPHAKVTGGFAYFRLRKDAYDAKGVDRWSKKIKELASTSRDCYVYLRHDETGENGLLAERLAEKLEP
jgi:uncharacterized protein YecE (DUF72 family)